MSLHASSIAKRKPSIANQTVVLILRVDIEAVGRSDDYDNDDAGVVGKLVAGCAAGADGT